MTAKTFGRRGLPPQPVPAPRRFGMGNTVAQSPAIVAAPPAEEPASLENLFAEKDLFAALPLLTVAIVLFLSVIFAIERNVSFELMKDGEPSVRSLTALGAASAALVFGQGEWWRILLAPLLHASFSHLAGNCFALFFAGMRLEPMIGRSWLAMVFVISALGGMAGSLAANPAALVTVGASGAITGLIGALFVVSFHHRADIDEQRRMRRTALRFGIPALAPLIFGATGHTDYFAHLGGAIAGGIAGFLICQFWQDHAPRPAYTRFAMIGSAASLALAVFAACFAAYDFSAQAAKIADKIPLAQLPDDLRSTEKRSTDLLARYPKDPNSHLIRAIYLSETRRFAAAEQEYRTAITLSGNDPTTRISRDLTRSLLAVVVAAQGRVFEAKGSVRDICENPPQPQFRKILDSARLCR